jgi:hypothetical protein
MSSYVMQKTIFFYIHVGKLRCDDSERQYEYLAISYQNRLYPFDNINYHKPMNGGPPVQRVSVLTPRSSPNGLPRIAKEDATKDSGQT